MEAFRTRALTSEYPYVWVDATYHKVRINGRVMSQATVVAVGVTREGERQVLGLDVGPSEDRAFWTAFLRGLVKRGLRGVRLVTSDAHEGVKQAIQHGATVSYEVPAIGVQMATVVITVGPIVLLYPFLQRYFVRGVTAGSVKG